jgi:16S rRNA (adenine1518-N6/adenine1519-N6)-dimethyltransferase
MDSSRQISEHIEPKKSLGQHWLHDIAVLGDIADAARIQPEDTILEVGPGLGTLTAELSRQARHVIAVELDGTLATGLIAELTRQSVDNVSVLQADILRFDFGTLPDDYKIVANIPYYLTSHLLRILTETPSKPSVAVLLMQKEVAERVCAKPGDMSILSVAVQLMYDAQLGSVVPARLFTPPPKVDSQVLILNRLAEPALNSKQLMRLVKIGFASKRKKLVNNLCAGYGMAKAEAEALLGAAHIDPNIRAEGLSIAQWQTLLGKIPA